MRQLTTIVANSLQRDCTYIPTLLSRNTALPVLSLTKKTVLNLVVRRLIPKCPYGWNGFPRKLPSQYQEGSWHGSPGVGIEIAQGQARRQSLLAPNSCHQRLSQLNPWHLLRGHQPTSCTFAFLQAP